MKNEQSKLSEVQFPRWEQLPAIDLYMDQIVQYLNTQLEPLNFDNNTVLTKSMINNYVKNSIVKAPVKKQYSNYHLAYLMVVILLKPCFSLQEISKMITIYHNLDDHDVSRDYNRFITIYESSIHDLMETGNISFRLYDHPSPAQQLMTSAITCAVMHLYTQYQLHQFNI